MTEVIPPGQEPEKLAGDHTLVSAGVDAIFKGMPNVRDGGPVPHLDQAQFDKCVQDLQKTPCSAITSEQAFVDFYTRLWQAGQDAINTNDLGRVEKLSSLVDAHLGGTRGHLDLLGDKLQSATTQLG